MKLFWLVVVVLAVPILPAMLVGPGWERWLVDFAAGSEESGHLEAALTIGGLLAADVFLPIPSGPLVTYAGARLGLLPAVAVVWCGLMSGAVIAFAVSKRWGRPVVQRFAGDEWLADLEAAFGDRVSWMLLVTRPLPVIAESAVLLAGLAGVAWGWFLPPVAIGSLAFAVALALVGRYAAENEVLIIALTLSAVLPVVATVWLRARWRSAQQASSSDQ